MQDKASQISCDLIWEKLFCFSVHLPRELKKCPNKTADLFSVTNEIRNEKFHSPCSESFFPCTEVNTNLIISKTLLKLTLRKKCPYSELFWSAFSYIRTEYGEIRSISSYSVRIRENADQNNSKYGHFYAVIT